MSNTVEIEAKMLINEKEYEKVVKSLCKNGTKEIVQTNYYLDTEDLNLEHYGLGLRIREKDNLYEFTLKAPLSEGLLEKTIILSDDEFFEILNGQNRMNSVFDFLLMLGFDINNIHVLSKLTTHRYECEYKNGILCVDKNFYDNKVDYELEFEHNSMNHALEGLKQFCEECGINHPFNKISKHQRAMQEYKNKKK